MSTQQFWTRVVYTDDYGQESVVYGETYMPVDAKRHELKQAGYLTRLQRKSVDGKWATVIYPVKLAA